MASYTYQIKTLGPKEWVVVYEYDKLIYEGNPSFSTSEDILIEEAKSALQNTYPEVVNMKPNAAEVSRLQANAYYASQTPTKPKPESPAQTPTGTTFNSPDTTKLKENSKELKNTVKDLQLKELVPSGKNIGKTIWENIIKPQLLTPRQIAKKILLMQGQSSTIPMSEEDAQFIVYGKLYYKNGKLYDNDSVDSNCVSKPTDDDYSEPLDKNHPLWQRVEKMIEDLEDSLIQLGIKLGEFVFAQPNAIISMTLSLTALVSSLTILPFGAGLPTALTAVQTMVTTIAELQSKTAGILPLLGIVDFIGLLLPKEAQVVIATINGIFATYMGILALIDGLLSPLEKILGALSSAKEKMNSMSLTVKAKADPSTVQNKIKGTKLSAEVTGGNWKYKYEWIDDSTGDLIAPADAANDDGTRIVTPQTTTTYRCKVTSGDAPNITKSEGTIDVIVL